MLLGFGLLFSVATMAQGGGGGGQRQPMPVADRVSRTIERLKPELKLEEKQVKDLEPVYTEYFTEMDKLRSAGQPSPEGRKKLTDDRDKKLEKILTADQLKKLKEIEEQMRQQRRPQQ